MRASRRARAISVRNSVLKKPFNFKPGNCQHQRQVGPGSEGGVEVEPWHLFYSLGDVSSNVHTISLLKPKVRACQQRGLRCIYEPSGERLPAGVKPPNITMMTVGSPQ